MMAKGIVGRSLAVAGFIVAGVSVSFAQSARDNVVFLKQAWTEDDRQFYYTTSQGSVVMSYDIFVNMEVANGRELFRSDANLDQYGLIPEPPNAKFNPDGLPVGITKTTITEGRWKGDWVGPTCAACHTGQLDYKGRHIRIDGGVANTFDIMAMVKGLDDALQSTVADSGKFDRLAAKLGATDAIAKSELRKRLGTEADSVHYYRSRSMLAAIAWGPGRMDALALIHNRVEGTMTGVPENWYPATAPVKSPFMWNAPQSEFVQWGGSLADPMLRNLSQSLGVYVQVDLTSKTQQEGLFDSTADIVRQWYIEKYLRRLAPPKWPEEILGKIDRTKARRGEQLFAENCSGCHTSWPYRWGAPRIGGMQFIVNSNVPIEIVGTDPTQLVNAIPFVITGPLADHMLPPFGGQQIVPPRMMLRTAFIGVFRKAIEKLHLSQADLDNMHGYNEFDPESPREPPPGDVFKAGPRDGVWATGPFLHNGSVPNLYEMLIPASERSKTFYIGREFDPVKVGVDTTKRPGSFLFDTSLLGNSNSGHSFESAPRTRGVIGRLLTDAERWAIVEYLKSIPDVEARVTPFGGPSAK